MERICHRLMSTDPIGFHVSIIISLYPDYDGEGHLNGPEGQAWIEEVTVTIAEEPYTTWVQYRDHLSLVYMAERHHFTYVGPRWHENGLFMAPHHVVANDHAAWPDYYPDTTNCTHVSRYQVVPSFFLTR